MRLIPLSLLVPLLLAAFVLPATAAPFRTDTWLQMSNHPDGNAAPPAYGLRLDGLNGNDADEFTFDFDDRRSDMRLYFDSTANTLRIRGVSWGGEDVGTQYAGGGSLYAIDFLYEDVMDLGPRLDVAPRGMNRGTIRDVSADVTYDLIDVAGRHDFSFRCEDGHRGAENACWGWVNHSGASMDANGRAGLERHVYSSDWLFTVDEHPIPEPSAALLFGLGSVVCGSTIRRRR